MNEIEELEKEIATLRSILLLKETRLEELKHNSQPSEDIPQTAPEYTTLQTVGDTYDVTGERSDRSSLNSNLPRWAIERYSRQILLPQCGVAGQRRLCGARVLVVGAGGLGCPAAAYLAGAGVGAIGIVDYDIVEVTNLHRQLLHNEDKVGMNKADSAADALRRLNSKVKIETHRVQLTSENALAILRGYDIALDCTDNMPTRYLLNDACVMLKIPLISGSALKMEGQLTIYNYRPNGGNSEKECPCYRCLFPAPPPPETVGSCSAQGVLGAAPGVIGTLQALEAIKLIAGRPDGELLAGRMLLFDGEDCSFRNVRLRGRNADCPVCSHTPRIERLQDYEEFCQTTAKEKVSTEEEERVTRQTTQLRKQQKENRMSGLPYFGFRREQDKWIQDVPKEERKQGPACSQEFCAKSHSKQCSDFSQDERKSIFVHFWYELHWNDKREMVKSLIDLTPPKRRRKNSASSRKTDSKVYHLIHEGRRAQVCRTMFLNTLGIKEAMVRSWLAHTEGPKLPKKKPLKAISVEAYLDRLPKFPPKCPQCRLSEKLYLGSEFSSQNELYRKYVTDMRSEKVEAASRKTFVKVLNAMNLNVFKPKNGNDVCDLIQSHNSTGVSTGT